jgi:uncharacterized membrane protein
VLSSLFTIIILIFIIFIILFLSFTPSHFHQFSWKRFYSSAAKFSLKNFPLKFVRSATKFRRHTIPVNIIEFAQALSGNSILHAPDAMPDTVGQDLRVLEKSIGNVVFIHLILRAADLCRGILTVDCGQAVYRVKSTTVSLSRVSTQQPTGPMYFVFCRPFPLFSPAITPAFLGPTCQLFTLYSLLTLYRRSPVLSCLIV